MQVGKIKNRARKFLGVNKYHPLLLNAAMTGILVVILLLTFALSHISGWKWLMWYGLVLLVAFYVFSAPVEYSAVDFYLRSYNLKSVENFKLFEGFKKENFWRSVLVRLIRTGMGLAFTVLLIVPGVLFMIRTAFVYYIMRSNSKTKAWDAIRESNQLVKGHTAEFFKICCSFIGWFLLGIISFGLAFIYVSPYYHSVKSVYFRNILMGINDAGAASAGTPKSVPKSNAELNAEIEKLERQLKALKNSTAAAMGQTVMQQKTTVMSKPKQTQTAPETKTAESAPIVEERTEMIADDANVAADQSVKETVTDTGTGPLVLDAVGDISLTSGDRVEEIEIPDVKVPEKETAASDRSNSEFLTRDIEIMENESFEDFKARVARLRKERDTGARFGANANQAKESAAATNRPNTDARSTDRQTMGAERSNASAGTNTGSDAVKRMSREEILEKLKQDRKNR